MFCEIEKWLHSDPQSVLITWHGISTFCKNKKKINFSLLQNTFWSHFPRGLYNVTFLWCSHVRSYVGHQSAEKMASVWSLHSFHKERKDIMWKTDCTLKYSSTILWCLIKVRKIRNEIKIDETLGKKSLPYEFTFLIPPLKKSWNYKPKFQTLARNFFLQFFLRGV